MSSSSVDLSSYRDQHFKVIYNNCCFPERNNIFLVFRVPGPNKSVLYENLQLYMLEIYHFTQPRNKYMNCFQDVERLDALSWAWINTKRHHVVFVL